MKIQKKFECYECGYISETWIGKCPNCNSWNSLKEIIISKQNKKQNEMKISDNLNPININEIQIENNYIIDTKISELDIFFGSGIVNGSVILLSGEPGIGKSTFLLYLANILSNKKIFYFSGEESKQQIKKRCNRVSIINNNIFISNQMEINSIKDICLQNKPDLIFIDSIQTCNINNVESNPGSVSQIRYCTSGLIELAKSSGIPVIIIGHITKTGEIAGPKILEHMVDVVIYFEGDSQHEYRILKSIKNRYGSIDEVLFFQMSDIGLNLIENPSTYFIDNDNNENVIGKCKTIILEGKKPLIIEVESLVIPSVYSNPRRFSEGVDVTRVNRIAAILDKYNNENLNNYDIYFNISGGIKTKDVGIDLAIAMSVYSSKNKIVIPGDYIFFGELSLTGKIRNIHRLEQKLKEAKRYGIKNIILPENNNNDNNLIKVTDVKKSIQKVFNK